MNRWLPLLITLVFILGVCWLVSKFTNDINSKEIYNIEEKL